jgi:cullin 1
MEPWGNDPVIKQQNIITLEAGWERVYTKGVQKLERIVQNGLKESFTNEEYMDLYTTIYQMCIQKTPHCYTPQLYERYEECIRNYLHSVVLPAIQGQRGEFLIQEAVRRWADHKLMQKWLTMFFRYLDRFYIKRHNKLPLADVCVGLFRSIVFDPTKTKLTGAILDMVKKDRDGDQADRSLLREAVQIYVELGMSLHNLTSYPYATELEAPYLKATHEYFSREAAQWLADSSCPEYLRKVEHRFAEERKRLEDYLHKSSEEKLMETLYQALLIQHQDEVLNKENTGCKVMLETDARDDLARMFNIYRNVPSSLEPIAKTVKVHIQQVGQTVIDKVNDQKNHDTYIQDLIAIHEKYHNLALMCFDHPVFHKALTEAFEDIVNKKTFQSSTAELLAQFADRLLNKGGLKLDEEELNNTMQNVIRLFSYLTDKDMFSEFYRKHLSKRLLLGRSASEEAEKAMIGKLKLKCGAQFTSKLEGMLNDMLNAADHHASFQAWLKENSIGLSGIEFSVQTLTTGNWPSYNTDECKLLPVMGRCIDAFRMYYNTKTSNRRLRWIHNLGTVTLVGLFTKRKIDVTVSAIQATILLLFNEFHELTIEDLMRHTGLPEEQMKAQLRSLVSGKFKLLIKTPADGYDVKHVVTANRGFTNPLRMIRVPNASNKVNNKERVAAQGAVDENRKHAVEACIVRIMKARKTLNHQILVAEVSQQLMPFFPPDPRVIKKRIEDLIARDYLERDAEKTNMYHYLA